jgi:transposase
MKVTTVGLDLAKNVFQVHGVDAEGRVVLRKRLRRVEIIPFFANLSPCLIGIEACATAHHWARELKDLGHEVKLMPPAYVKPYIKRGKNDVVDAGAVCEAVSRPSMRFVPIKSAEQQSVLMLHRARSADPSEDDAGQCAPRPSRRIRDNRRPGVEPCRQVARGRGRRGG